MYIDLFLLHFLLALGTFGLGCCIIKVMQRMRRRRRRLRHYHRPFRRRLRLRRWRLRRRRMARAKSEFAAAIRPWRETLVETSRSRNDSLTSKIIFFTCPFIIKYTLITSTVVLKIYCPYPVKRVPCYPKKRLENIEVVAFRRLREKKGKKREREREEGRERGRERNSGRERNRESKREKQRE